MASIEHGFPIGELDQLARIESYRKNIHRPIYHVHKWWAKRLGSVFRSIVLGALLPDSEEIWPKFYSGHDFQGRVVLDPFMGSGTTLGEALRLGCKVIGQDINPVAWFQVKKALEQVDLAKLDNAFTYLEQNVSPQLTDLYRTTCPECAGEAQVLYAFWVKVLPCPDCGTGVDLFTTRFFSKNVYPAKDPVGYATCPRCGAVNKLDVLDCDAVCDKCGHGYDPNVGAATSKDFTCPTCGKTHQIVKVVRALGHVPEHRMYALDTLCPVHGRSYKAPTQADLDLYAEAGQRLTESHLIPNTPIPEGYNTKQIRNFNYRYWRDCFNDRQLYSLSTLLDGILSMPESVADQNVKELLVLLLSACLEFNNMFCSFKGRGTGAVRHMFSHHVLCPEKVPLENNLWGTPDSSGSFSTLFYSKLRKAKEWGKRPTERLLLSGGKTVVSRSLDKPVETKIAVSWSELASGEAKALVRCASSTSLSDVPDGVVDAVITDPPYFDMVNYSELADFFYAWLRLGLEKWYPEFTAENTRRAEEAIVNLAQGKTPEFYQDVLASVLAEARRVLKDDGVVAFTFHHAAADAWLSILNATRQAGLVCTAVWPIQGEMSVGVPILGKKNAIEHDMILVFRKCQTPDPEPIEWSSLAQQIVAETEVLFGRLVAQNKSVPPGDKLVIASAVWLKRISQHPAVQKDGQKLLADETLSLLAKEV